jgi:hypothetical protein
VGAVAKRLAATHAAGTPKILFAFNYFDRVGGFLCDNRIRHGKFSNASVFI